nr:uncharacterized protein LOC132418609 [Delphinus delphis]
MGVEVEVEFGKADVGKGRKELAREIGPGVVPKHIPRETGVCSPSSAYQIPIQAFRGPCTHLHKGSSTINSPACEAPLGARLGGKEAAQLPWDGRGAEGARGGRGASERAGSVRSAGDAGGGRAELPGRAGPGRGQRPLLLGLQSCEDCRCVLLAVCCTRWGGTPGRCFGHGCVLHGLVPACPSCNLNGSVPQSSTQALLSSPPTSSLTSAPGFMASHFQQISSPRTLSRHPGL